MKGRYIILALSIVAIQSVYPAKYSAKKDVHLDRKAITGELHTLVEKRNLYSLSLDEMHRIRYLLGKLAKLSQRDADYFIGHLGRIDSPRGSNESSEFERRQWYLELENEFKHPSPKDMQWRARTERALAVYRESLRPEYCGEPDEGSDFINQNEQELYENAVKKYESLTHTKYIERYLE